MEILLSTLAVYFILMISVELTEIRYQYVDGRGLGLQYRWLCEMLPHYKETANICTAVYAILRVTSSVVFRKHICAGIGLFFSFVLSILSFCIYQTAHYLRISICVMGEESENADTVQQVLFVILFSAIVLFSVLPATGLWGSRKKLTSSTNK